jgi:hypothetical protein
MSTGHPGDYGNAIMQKQGFFHRPNGRLCYERGRRMVAQTAPVSGNDAGRPKSYVLNRSPFIEYAFEGLLPPT